MQFFGEEPSPEVREQIEAEMARSQMQADEYRHRMTRLFKELGEDDLQSLRWMLHHFVVQDGSQLAAYYEGQIAVISEKYGICPSCGVNHEKEMQAHLNAENGSEQEKPAPYIVDVPLPTMELTAEDAANMKRYHLDDLRDEDTNELLGFVCTGIEGMKGPCGMRYPSIEDRMLRGPEECSACFVKMAHG